MGNDKPDFEVIKAVPESSDVVTLYVKPNQAAKFAGRKAGQFATLRVMREDGFSEPHPFTISAGPEEDALRFTIKCAGEFTSKIKDLTPGTALSCAGPYGEFCKDIDSREDVMLLAGGVGITPFLSVLRHFAQTGAKNRVTLVWSNKLYADAFAAAELSELASQLNLRVVLALSREEKLPDGLPPGICAKLGRISAAMLRELVSSPSTSFYVCGPAPMQEEMLNILGELGVDPAFIQKEAFNYKPRPKA